MKTRIISASLLRNGDTIIRRGQPKTLSKSNLKHHRFFGTTCIDGIAVRGEIEQCLFPCKWENGRPVAYASQR